MQKINTEELDILDMDVHHPNMWRAPNFDELSDQHRDDSKSINESAMPVD